MTESAEVRRTLFTLVVRDYSDVSDSFVKGIDGQLDELRAWWCASELADTAFTVKDLGAIANRRDVQDAVHHAGLSCLSEQDIAVVYIVGHGRAGASGRHFLLLPDTPHDRFAQAYPTADAVFAALDSDARHILVVINSCFSGALQAELAALRKDLAAHRRDLATLNVFTSADFDEMPRVGEFGALLERVRNWLSTQAGYADPFLSVDDFERELIDAANREPRLLVPRRVWRAGPSTQPSPCIPNPGYRPPDDVVTPARRQVADTATDLDYWLDRASGRLSASDPGWYFAGRRDLTVPVAQFLRTGTGLILVTGAAGTGKSAIIARAVTLSDPGFLTNPRYRAALSAAPPDTLPPPGSIDVAILARNKETDEIAEQLLLGLGQQPRAAVGSTSRTQDLRAELEAHLRASDRVRTLVVDGLDEARQPTLLVINLLGPLARLTDEHGRRRVRLIVGVRSSTPGEQHSGIGDIGHELVDLVRRSAITDDLLELRTDEPSAHTAIVEYVDALLASPPSPYASDPHARAEMATAVADHVTPSFLDARLAAQHLRSADGIKSSSDPELVRSWNEGTIGLLRQDLLDAATDDHSADELLAALRVTAFAQGAGIPWADIWPTATSAVLDRPLPNANDTIAHLLASRLSGYLARDTEDGRVVYRPVHELLSQVLRAQPHRLRGEQP